MTLMVLGAGADASANQNVIALLIILAAASVVAIIARRVQVSAISAYLMTGAIIGPLGLAEAEAVVAIEELALILLMFGIGLHMERRSFAGAFGTTAAIGVGSTLMTFGLLFPTALLLGVSVPGAIVIGMALSLSSTAVVLRLLQQRRMLHVPSGRLAFATLLMQDLLVIGMLALVPVLARMAAGAEPGPDGEAAAGPDYLGLVASVAGVGLLVVVGRRVLPWLFNEAARARADEVMLVLAAAVALGAAVVTTRLGFGSSLGAFLAGLLLASTPFRHHLSGLLSSIRDLFMAVFFTAVGMTIDPAVLLTDWWVILIGLVLLVGIKSIGIAFVAWAVGTTPRIAIITALTLAQAGEFSLVVLAAAESQGGVLLSPEVASTAVAIIAGSLVVTPGLMWLAETLGARARGLPTAPWINKGDTEVHDEMEGTDDPGSRHVIVAGFGPVGRAVTDRLEEAGLRVTIIELNAETVRRQQEVGRRVVFGDVASPDVLESAGLREAHAIVLTMPDDEAMLRTTKTIRIANPNIFIAARANYLSKAMQAQTLGADHVVTEELVTAYSMEQQVLEALKLDKEEAEAGS